MKTIQIKNNIINLEQIRKISYSKMPTEDYDEPNNYKIQFTYSNGDTENYDMTYEKFQSLLDIIDNKVSFVIDDTINTRFAHEIK